MRVPVSPLMQSWEECLVLTNDGLTLPGSDFIPNSVPERVPAVPFHQSCRIAMLNRADSIETIIGIIFVRSKRWSFPEAPKKHNPVLRFQYMMAWVAWISPSVALVDSYNSPHERGTTPNYYCRWHPFLTLSSVLYTFLNFPNSSPRPGYAFACHWKLYTKRDTQQAQRYQEVAFLATVIIWKIPEHPFYSDRILCFE